jgi:acetyl-CoA synthetase
VSQPAWVPTKEEIQKTRLYQWMNKCGFDDYDAFYQKSIQDIQWFWEQAVRELNLQWKQPYSNILDLSDGIANARWFVDGKLNIADNSLDRFALDPSASERVALIWEGENGDSRTYTYRELWDEVCKIASGFKKLGISKGDRVAIYLPMIPEIVIAMLAIARIGAIFTPCFSGFGAEAIATRVQDCEAKVFVTADGFHRRGKTIEMKKIADEAVKMCPSIEKVVVVKRLNLSCPWNPERDLEWDQLRAEGREETSEATDANDPFMIIYTSGTTGKPKGTVHVHSGFPVKAAFDAGLCMDVGPGDCLFWVTDMGWMMGPWMVFGALVNGAAMLLYDGTPDYPDPGRLWQIVAKYGVTHLGISPTLIRSLMKHDVSYVTRHQFDRLRAIASTGEPWNPEPWYWLFEQVGKKRVPILNYSGGTEISGGILGNILLKPIYPCGFNSPIPGMDVEVYDEQGKPLRGEVGELVIRQPWVGMTKSFWNNHERYLDTYWSRWPDTWVHGDWVYVDAQGQWYITGRSDDTIKVAGKRLGPAEMESVLVSHPAVLEACTIGVPDQEKGEVPVCFVILRSKDDKTPDLFPELQNYVAEKMGKALKPKQIWIVDELPKTRNGKIMRRVVRSAYLGKDPGDLSALENPQAVKTIQALSQT